MPTHTKPKRSLSTFKFKLLASVGKRLFWETRTRILAYYVGMMVFFLLLSVPLFFELVISQVEQRVKENLAEEVTDFEAILAQNSSPNSDQADIDIKNIFSNFLRQNIVEDDNYLITFIDGEFYKSNPRALPRVIVDDFDLLEQWGNQTVQQQNQINTNDPTIGNLIYRVKPVIINGEQYGVLVAVHATAGELQEARTALTTVVQVLLVVLTVALAIAWIASQKVLQPLHSAIKTARAIGEGESDLSQRLEIEGRGEMRQLCLTFNHMMNRLETAFATQREFVNDAGHELRTPITIILGHLELMDDNDPEDRQATMALVQDELKRMSRLVEDLILLAKAERPHFLYLEPVELETFTRELYNKAKGLARRHWQLDGVGIAAIYIDRQRLTQAMMNLAQNAAQYTSEKDTIAIGSSVNRQSVYFWVRDTGEGIRLEDQEQIFRRFARGSSGRRRSDGAGLGLAIVSAIAHSHGGRVELNSKYGFGSTFTIVLPRTSTIKSI